MKIIVDNQGFVGATVIDFSEAYVLYLVNYPSPSWIRSYN